MLRFTTVDPGVVTNHAPLLLDSLQVAPARFWPFAALVSTETLWLVPLTIEAQPAN